ncbi:MAG TPA: hypothetical protein VFQ53_12520 [Kofleriaceae bacterium]|nr:hypothetical protein [Kofleriaceae bacterium]
MAPSAGTAPAGGGKIDLPSFIKTLTANTDSSRMAKVKSMLRADRFQLFSEVTDDHVTGVVKSQTDGELVYACRLGKSGEFFCCTQNLNHCGGLRGALCKHVLVLIIGLTQSGQLGPELAHRWAAESRKKKPALDKDAATATFVRYKGAEAGEVDWRPTETLPEDYYAL